MTVKSKRPKLSDVVKNLEKEKKQLQDELTKRQIDYHNEISALEGRYEEKIAHQKRKTEEALENVKVMRGREDALYLKWMQRGEELAILKEWKNRADLWMREVLARGAVRAKYDRTYFLVREAIRVGITPDKTLFYEIAKQDRGVNLKDVAHILEEFGIVITDDMLDEVQGARRDRSTITVKNKNGKETKYDFNFDKDSVEAAKKDVWAQHWDIPHDPTEVIAAVINAVTKEATKDVEKAVDQDLLKDFDKGGK